MLDHFRHLLVESPELQARTLRGGLAIWLLQNTQKVFTASTSARDAWQAKDYQTARNQIIGMLDYLEGKTLALKDLPPGSSDSLRKQAAQITTAISYINAWLEKVRQDTRMNITKA